MGPSTGAGPFRGTAKDRQGVCRGASSEKSWGPAGRQGRWLVAQACERGHEGWPDKGGSAKLRALFDALFPKPRNETWSQERADEENAAMLASMIERGILTPPCAACEPGAPYCEYGGLKRHQRARAEEEKARLNVPPPRRAPMPIDVGKILSQGRIAFEDEQRRKREQLEGTEMA